VNNNNQLLKSPIQPGHSRAELIHQAAVIIWDEAPMVNKAVFACIHKVCHKVMENDLPFRGKVVILLGDFCQTCPVIRGGSKVQVINTSIKSSPLWRHVVTLGLMAPFRNAQDPKYQQFVDAIGDGVSNMVELDLLRQTTCAEELIDFVYPADILLSPHDCLSHAILAPTNEQIDVYNATILDRIEGLQRSYIAADSLKEAEESELRSPDGILDYICHHSPPGLPPHNVTIKVNAVF
jgi:PIF1-like helicase